MKFTFRGMDTIAANLRYHAKKAPEREARALYEEMEIELTECQKITPVDTGFLKDSEHLDGPIIRGNVVDVKIVADADYAAAVHENLEAFHKEPTSAKFIERPFMAARPYLAARIARRLRVEDWKD